MRKRMAVLLGLAGAIGALAAQEAWQRRVDERRIDDGRDFWRLNLDPEDVRWADQHLESFRIPSDGVGINLDVYAQPDVTAPVIVIAHGLLTYGRIYVTLARAYYDRGYTVILPDMRGDGFSGGVRGDCTTGEATANLVDATIWTRKRFDGPIFLFGISLGGALVYAAAAAGAPVSAICCVNLFAFDDLTALRQLVAQPKLIATLPLLRLLAGPLGWLRIPIRLVHRIEASVAPEELPRLEAMQFDPVPSRAISLRSIVSAASTPPAVPFELNTMPTLVMNQGEDRVLVPAVTRASYARLGGPKRYVELTGSAHWSFTPKFWLPIIEQSTQWFTQHRPHSPSPNERVMEYTPGDI